MSCKLSNDLTAGEDLTVGNRLRQILDKARKQWRGCESFFTPIKTPVTKHVICRIQVRSNAVNRYLDPERLSLIAICHGITADRHVVG